MRNNNLVVLGSFRVFSLVALLVRIFYVNVENNTGGKITFCCAIRFLRKEQKASKELESTSGNLASLFIFFQYFHVVFLSSEKHVLPTVVLLRRARASDL